LEPKLKVSSRTTWIGIVITLLLSGIVLVRSAWVTDDAFITLRVVENLVHGYGPNFNVGYRVQVYTHPLWLLVLSSVYSGLNQFFAGARFASLYNVTVFTSLTLSLLTFGLFWWGNRARPWMASLGLVALCLSKSVVDYTVSGLENPLTNLLTMGFGLVYFAQEQDRAKLFWLALIAALAAVNRQDSILLFLPALVYVFWKSKSKRSSAGFLLLGFLPLLAWESFSLCYYGYPVPNTAFAKLNTGIAGITLAKQGFWYLVNAVRWDAVTMIGMLAGAAVLAIKRQKRALVFMLGAGLYVLYIVKVGGDFMTGRFLGAPYLLVMVAMCQMKLPRRSTVAIFLLIAVMGLANLRSPLYAHAAYGAEMSEEQLFDAHGVADERGVYYTRTGLLSKDRDRAVTWNYWQSWALTTAYPQVRVMRVIGMAGYLAGPDAVILDELALADPLLSHLPVHVSNWRIGHFRRAIPRGYFESLEKRENEVVHDGLAQYLEAIKLNVQGKLFSAERLAAIWRLNTGYYDDLLAQYVAQEYVHLE
jgi:arabinofuranosyltransferase